MTGKYFEGIGSRKVALARVRLYPAKDNTHQINGKPLEHFIKDELSLQEVMSPLVLVGMQEKYVISANITGGGTTGWKDAIKLGVARALILMDEKLKPALRKAGMVTRDARAVERKKAGLKKARKAPRFSKR